jgi:hypothetical protein
MNRTLYHAAFVVGLAAIGWVAAGYVGANPLGLAMVLLIAAFYAMGALELHRFHQATDSLSRTLLATTEPPAQLGPWLDGLHPSLQTAVRLRVDGERIGLPGPALTPYLAGLLVLLGMLGTFLGMVATLRGTGLALEGATDLQAIRASLVAPVKGLGLAFGSSVAGVAASAMLGLMSALCRRERLQAGQALDACIATRLHAFSRAHQREAALQLLHAQAGAMPELTERLQALMAQIERQSEGLNERLLAGHERFFGKAEAAYAGLASSIDRSLRQSLNESARAAGATIQPVVEATMAGIARETAALQAALAGSVQRQLDGLSSRFETTTAAVVDTWQTALAAQQVSNDRHLQHTHEALDAAATTFGRQADTLLAAVDRSQAALAGELAARDEQRLAAWTASLQAMAAALQSEWREAGAQALAQQQHICRTWEQTARDIAAQSEAHARNTVAEIGRLVQAAAEAPEAAAELVARLRETLSDSLARDNEALQERNRILQGLGALLDSVGQAASEQRGAVDRLVATSAAGLAQAQGRFNEAVDAESGKLAAVAAQVNASAVEVASLGEAFGHAVHLFSQSNDKLTGHLQRIEAALAKSIARSDEQLGYYVAQAREIIDLSIMSQKQIVEDLQQMARQPARIDG